MNPDSDPSPAVSAGALLEALATGGSVHFENAIVAGAIEFRFDAVRQAVTFINCTFDSPVDFSHTEFQRPVLISGCRFRRGVRFRGSTFRHEVRFVSGIIEGESADFREVHMAAQVDFNAVNFACSTINFAGARLDAVALFRSYFSGRAIFARIHARESATFEGAVFKKEAVFNGARIDQGGFFRGNTVGAPPEWIPSTVFEAQVDFTKAHFGGGLLMQGVEFKGPAIFNSLSVDGSVFFRPEPSLGLPAAVFHDTADFRTARVDGSVDLRSVMFRRGVSFNSARIGGEFDLQPFSSGDITHPASRLESDADFSGTEFVRSVTAYDAVFRGSVGLGNTTFGGAAAFEGCKFEAKVFCFSARFSRDANFSGAEFNEDATFAICCVEGTALFNRTKFSRRVSFRDSHFRSVHFVAPTKASQFPRGVDWRGCTYEHLDADYVALAKSISPYERSVLVRLEKHLRDAGYDQTADTIYLLQRRKERQRRFKAHDFLGWLFDWAYRIGANYGVRPYRLLGLALAVITAGAVFFSDPRSVIRKDPPGSRTPPATWTRADAIGVALRQFFPIELPIGSEWEPTTVPLPVFGSHSLTIRADWFASLLRVAGWVLIPLGVAAVTGLLKRPTS